MPDESSIRVNTLLLEREALFVRIHEIEQATATIFGEPYPFTRPVLPSDQRSKRKSTARSGTAASKDKPLRKLDLDEVAYRVTYRQLGQTRTETHDTPDALRTLLASQSAQLQVLLIETITADGASKTVLHSATA
ncbi:MAG: hypothetical protein WC205_09840 [Opitutaceae bacterium]|jgi:hypothetical protein